jgi:glutamate-ammonia-ligase adenylyltransferase
MALTRARPIFGSLAARGAVGEVVRAVLDGARPARDIVAEAVTMRAEMGVHKSPAGPLDAKLLPGGLVDLEFAVHTQQLVHRTGFAPGLGDAVRLLVAQRLLPEAMIEAHDFLTRLLVTVRLVAPDSQPPGAATRALIARAVGVDDWNAVLAELERVRQEVAHCWRRVGQGDKNAR